MNHNLTRLFCTLACVFASAIVVAQTTGRAGTATAAAADTAKEIEFPVTRVVLYSSGVGFFEHSTNIDGNAKAAFSFKPTQINDVLKSMVLRDAGGGSVQAINYASQDPLERALQSFAVDISDRPTFAQLLAKLRGAEVTVMSPQAIKGRIFSVEEQNRQLPAASGGAIVRDYVLTLLTAEGLRAFPLSSVASLRLTDPRLESELQRALELMITSADEQRKGVEIRFDGKGKRAVSVSYVSEAPIWKTSYRLDLSGTKPYLQGWAIVENTSDNDWQNVQLSLVSGSPISFIQDLYTPLYLQRRVIGPSLQASISPQTYDRGVVTPGAIASAPASAMSGAGLSSLRTAEASEDAFFADQEASRSIATSTLSNTALSSTSAGLAQADSGKFGELFRFTIKSPVTLSRRQSAMLPLVNQDVIGEKVSIYNTSVLARNPLNGVQLTNTTGTRLPPGPLTIYDMGMYAGDALVDSMAPGEKRLLSYAVDLDLSIIPSVQTSSEVNKISIVRGVLTINRNYAYTQTYRISSEADTARSLIIEHPLNASRTLAAGLKPEETTATHYRFKTTIDKKGTTDFVVRENQPVSETIALLSSRSATFLAYTTWTQTSPALKSALQRAAELRNAVDDVQTRINALSAERTTIYNDQSRLRANLDSVGRDTTQGQRYLSRLLEQEDRLDAIVKELETNQEIQRKAQAAFDDYVRNLSVE